MVSYLGEKPNFFPVSKTLPSSVHLLITYFGEKTAMAKNWPRSGLLGKFCWHTLKANASSALYRRVPKANLSEIDFTYSALMARSRRWEGPDTPQAWLTAMARKKASLSRWEAAVAKGGLLDHPVDLGNLFNPNTFLNAVRQQVCKPC